jgi:hypothetical protein
MLEPVIHSKEFIFHSEQERSHWKVLCRGMIRSELNFNRITLAYRLQGSRTEVEGLVRGYCWRARIHVLYGGDSRNERSSHILDIF